MHTWKQTETVEKPLRRWQSAFIKRHNTQDYIFPVKQQQKEAYVAFVDLEKAFDKSSVEKIWDNLKKLHKHQKLNKAFKSLYHNNTS